jgi:hypothetical protein
MTTQHERTTRRLAAARSAHAEFLALHADALLQSTVRGRDGSTGWESDIARTLAEIERHEKVLAALDGC